MRREPHVYRRIHPGNDVPHPGLRSLFLLYHAPENIETRKGRPGQYRDGGELLPTCEELRAELRKVRSANIVTKLVRLQERLATGLCLYHNNSNDGVQLCIYFAW
jgi:hypothetical protein